MKYLLFALCLTLGACKKDQDNLKPAPTIVGQWRGVETRYYRYDNRQRGALVAKSKLGAPHFDIRWSQYNADGTGQVWTQKLDGSITSQRPFAYQYNGVRLTFTSQDIDTCYVSADSLTFVQHRRLQASSPLSYMAEIQTVQAH